MKKKTLHLGGGVYLKNNHGLPNRAKDIEWCKELRKKFKVYFVSCIERNNEKKVIDELREIFDIENPNVEANKGCIN